MPLLHIGSTSQNTCFMVHLPNWVLKPAHRPSRCVTGLRDGGMELLVGIGVVYPTLFCTKKPGIRRILCWTKGFPCQKPKNALKTLVLAKVAWSGSISVSGMKENVIQKTGASSITNLGFFTRQFSYFQRWFRSTGGRIRNIGKPGCRHATYVRNVWPFEIHGK